MFERFSISNCSLDINMDTDAPVSHRHGPIGDRFLSYRVMWGRPIPLGPLIFFICEMSVAHALRACCAVVRTVGSWL